MLSELLSTDIFKFMLVFARFGAALMLFPGIGSSIVSSRLRLLLALAITFVALPVLQDRLPPLPGDVLSLFVMCLGEVAIGVFLAMLVQIMMSALELAGNMVATQANLANALVFDPVTEQQAALVTGFFSNLAVLLILMTGMHHLFLRALIDSYGIFTPGQPLPMGDFAEALVKGMGAAFAVALQLSAPVVISGLVFQIGMGLLSRLMPQMQVFFVVMPLQTLMGLAVLMISLSSLMLWFLRFFESGLIPFTGQR